MSDVEFLSDIEKNAIFLRAYPNYLNYFAFPFGQPERTFTKAQVQLLLDAGVKKVFSSAASYNQRPCAPFLDRVALLQDDDTPAKIRFRVLKPLILNRKMSFSNEYSLIARNYREDKKRLLA